MIIFLCIFRCAGDGSFHTAVSCTFFIAHMCAKQGGVGITIGDIVLVAFLALYLICWIAVIVAFVKYKRKSREERIEAVIQLINKLLAES